MDSTQIGLGIYLAFTTGLLAFLAGHLYRVKLRKLPAGISFNFTKARLTFYTALFSVLCGYSLWLLLLADPFEPLDPTNGSGRSYSVRVVIATVISHQPLSLKLLGGLGAVIYGSLAILLARKPRG